MRWAHAIKHHVEIGALRDTGIIAALAVLGALVDKQRAPRPVLKPASWSSPSRAPGSRRIKSTRGSNRCRGAAQGRLFAARQHDGRELDLIGASQGAGWSTLTFDPDRIRRLRGR